MKTPHRIDLIYGETVKQFNPLTGEYEDAGSVTIPDVPCLVNVITQERIAEMYGDRERQVIICRFNQEQPPFQRARYKNKLFKPIESIDAPIKGAMRLIGVDE